MSEILAVKLIPSFFEAASFILRLALGFLLCYLVAQLVMKYGGKN